jgi:hypothetical protein
VARQFPVWGLLIGVAAFVVVGSWRWLGTKVGRLTLPLALLAALAVFLLGHEGGVVAAHQQYVLQRQTDYRAYPRIQVWPKEEINLADRSPTASGDLTNGCYRLILHNQNRLFLVRPLKGAPSADLPLLVLRWDQIEHIRLLPDQTSCE